jgi:hypothetical protein
MSKSQLQIAEDVGPYELDNEILKCYKKITERQRRFVDIYAADCRMTITEAARKAGYSGKAPGSGLTNNRHVNEALHLLRYRHQLMYGISAEAKRKKLLQIADMASTPGETYNPSAAVGAIRELNMIDGTHKAIELKHSGQLNLVTIDYQLNTGRKDPAVIEGELVTEDDTIKSLF